MKYLALGAAYDYIVYKKLHWYVKEVKIDDEPHTYGRNFAESKMVKNFFEARYAPAKATSGR